MEKLPAKRSVTWRNIGWIIFLLGAATVLTLSEPMMHRDPPIKLACLAGGIVMAFGLFVLIAEPSRK